MELKNDFEAVAVGGAIPICWTAPLGMAVYNHII